MNGPISLIQNTANIIKVIAYYFKLNFVKSTKEESNYLRFIVIKTVMQKKLLETDHQKQKINFLKKEYLTRNYNTVIQKLHRKISQKKRKML